MCEFIRQIEGVIQQLGLGRSRQELVVAVSGGLDSMVLLHALHQLASARRWRLVVAHYNHTLRGRASNADEQLVRQTADHLGLQCVAESGRVREEAAARGLSIEMAARELRHAFLAQTARRLRIRRVALAHHADDQVELFFVRLLRGAGSEGLGGMKWSAISPADPQVTLIRPLLGHTRASLAEWAKAERIRHREDASNAARDHLRNRIRHELVPLLTRDYQPALTRVIGRLMELLRAESEVIFFSAGEWLLRPNELAYERLAVGLQRRVLLVQLQAMELPGDFELVEALRAETGRVINVNPHLAVWRTDDGRVHRQAVEPATFREETVAIDLQRQAGPVQFGGATFRWRVVGRAGVRRPAGAAGCEWFDADRVGPVATLRHWRPGDRFQPSGMAGPVKLQDLFTNLRVPRAERLRRVVAVNREGTLWWVEGLRIAEAFKLQPETRRRLRWQWAR